MSGEVSKAIYRFLDTDGDGTGTKNANGDYSSAADEFFFQPDQECDIHRLIFHMTDTTGIQQEEYGNIGGALTNGYNIVVRDDSDATILSLTDNIPIKTNGDIGRYCYDVELKSWGAGNEAIQGRWTFTKAGAPLRLPQNYKFSITLNDTLTGLLEHYFMIQGYEID